MVEIPLTKGYVARVDDVDAGLARFKWTADVRQRKDGSIVVYAVRGCSRDHNRVYMHREIMGFPSGDVDHENRDGTDNQRLNLRYATRSLNHANRQKTPRNGKATSRFKGVHYDPGTGKWIAKVQSTHIGCFVDEIDAATAYNFIAVERFGEFARCNVP